MTTLTSRSALAAVRKRALSYPEAVEHHPWGDDVIKVNGKIFVFLGAGKDGFGLSVKLPATHELALTRRGTRPTPYGLGRAGWVSLQTGAVSAALLAEVMDWVDESYRAIAPKKLVTLLDARAARPPGRR
jgi:predicted DNA-binding protein (MmcQ/YjbR family)